MESRATLNMNDILKVTAAVIIKNRQVLITQRHSDDDMGEKWEFPGGKIEAGETPEACLQRELQEELDIRTDVHEMFVISEYSYPTFDIELLAYRTTIRSGQIALSAHQDYRWVPIDELKTFDFLEADKPIVEKLMYWNNNKD